MKVFVFPAEYSGKFPQRLPIVVLVCVLLLRVSSFNIAKSAEDDEGGLNLIDNHGFEMVDESGKPSPWFIHKWVKDDTEFKISRQAHNGTNSFTMIGGTGGCHGDIGMTVKFLPNTVYRYGAWIKVEDSHLIKFQALYFEYALGGAVEGKYIVRPEGTECRFLAEVENSHDWKYYEIIFKTSSKVNPGGLNGCIRPIYLFEGKGQIWLDDVKLELVKDKYGGK